VWIWKFPSSQSHFSRLIPRYSIQERNPRDAGQRWVELRPQLHDTGFASERHQILQFHGESNTQNYDNITEVVRNFKYEKL
jgi:hypothetical protein